jgi:hypothetical protein
MEQPPFPWCVAFPQRLDSPRWVLLLDFGISTDSGTHSFADVRRVTPVQLFDLRPEAGLAVPP